MTKNKKLSNPFSTGGGGVHFEAQVQASFVTLMLTGGSAPCLPSWPIVEIKFQGKIDGFDTDDIIVTVENINTKERRKLLGQIKHSIEITKGNAVFGEVIQAAWNDFNNSKIFTPDIDAIALITGPLNKTDIESVPHLLRAAECSDNAAEFFRKIQQPNFSSTTKVKKLAAIKHHLTVANNRNTPNENEFYHFLKNFHLLGYDLGGNYSSVILSFLHSHIAQYHYESPETIWTQIVNIVQTWNQNSGTITIDHLPNKLQEIFSQKEIIRIPQRFKIIREKSLRNWTEYPDSAYLALAILLGGWNEQNESDLTIITQLFDISYDEWLKKAREILHYPDRPLSVKNGIWVISDRIQLWQQLGSCILDQNLDTFTSLAISVLQEKDPAFELPLEKRYLTIFYDKMPKYSFTLKKGIAEGLAILANHPQFCLNCSQGKAKVISILVIREILTDGDWILWASLNDLLPILAEAAPDEFLHVLERVMNLKPCPFTQIFSQQNQTTGKHDLTGLLWALEALAWDKDYLVRVCVILAELASYDPNGQWADRLLNSLATILLPWSPQTLAPVETRMAAVQTIFNEVPDIGWDLIIQLLPGKVDISTGSNKPQWRNTIPDDWKKEVTEQEYWQQSSFYAELAVSAVGQNITRLTELIDHFNFLPNPAFGQFLKFLTSQPIIELAEEQRLPIWEHLRKLINKHWQYSDSEWALPKELINQIEYAANQLTPINPFNLYQHLFTDDNFDLYEENGNWQEQSKKLDLRRETAVLEIFQQEGINGIIQLTELVSSPVLVGSILSQISDLTIEQKFFPNFLDSENNRHKALLCSFINQRYRDQGEKWCNSLDKSTWTPKQLGIFLSYLPFIQETWHRVNQWLDDQENEYWIRVRANIYQADCNINYAIEKLIEHNNPSEAIYGLSSLIRYYDKKMIDHDQCIRALLVASNSDEVINKYQNKIIQLIKFLQTESLVNKDDLLKIEWKYLFEFNDLRGSSPKTLENKLAHDPEFFCEITGFLCGHDNEIEDQFSKESLKLLVKKSRHLLRRWKTPPGIQEDGSFNKQYFENWLNKVKDICTESNHLDTAFNHIGAVLVYAPPDPNGLWIHRSVAHALNHREAEKIRQGYYYGVYNSRGVVVNPTVEKERARADQFRIKAKAVENAGFRRFAVTLRDLAKSYDQYAERFTQKVKSQ